MTGLEVTDTITLTAASSVTGGSASILIKQNMNAYGALVLSASAVHEADSGSASSATVTVQGDLSAASVDISATVSRNYVDGSLGLADYDFGDATATLTVADGADITGGDVNLSATVDGVVRMGADMPFQGNIAAATASFKFVVITAKDVATVSLGNSLITASTCSEACALNT